MKTALIKGAATASPSAQSSRYGTTLIACCAIFGGAPYAEAFQFPTDNPDLAVRWDNTFRYSLGSRVEGQSSRILRNAGSDESDAKFDKGDLITNRLDLLSEFDLVYKSRHGFRVSGAGWYDNAYRDSRVKTGVDAPGSYDNDRYSSTTKRYYHGPSGELLDAFVFSGFDVGEVPVNFKAGRHAVVWGEGLLLGGHAISYRQGPIDGRKGAENPAAETKELFLPVGQLSFQSSLSDTVSVAGEYFFEWQPDRFPEGGTYLGVADFLWSGPDRWNGWNRRHADEPGNTGEWGLNMVLTPRWLNGNTLGLYYREFNERQGWIQSNFTDFYRLVYATNTRLYGVSLNVLWNGVSIGSEVSYRNNAALNGTANLDGEGPRGNTWHGVVNAVASVNGGGLFDTGILLGEVAYSKLASVTDHKELYNGVGYGGCLAGQGKWDGCSTDEVVQTSVRFTPQWLSALEGIDISMPMAITYGVHGNGATLGGGNQGSAIYSIGVEADVNQFYKVGLTFADASSHSRENGGNGPWQWNDRGRVTLTVKATY